MTSIKKLLIACVVLTGLVGCQTISNLMTVAKENPRARYVLASEGFKGVVVVLTELTAAGAFSDTDLARIDALVTRGSSELGKWNAALLAGDNYSGGTLIILGIIEDLLPFYQKGDSK